MCAICKEDIIARLSLREIKSAGFELVSTAETAEEIEHIIERLIEIETQHVETVND